jgi:myosin heavy subunit
VERDIRAKEEASVIIQTAWRTWSARNTFLEMHDAAITIQSAWRMAADREFSARRLQAVLTIQRHWRAAQRHRIDVVSHALQVATDGLVAALTEFAAAARADVQAALQVDKAELRRIEAATTIQTAWREHETLKSVRSTCQYLLDVYERASRTVMERDAAARAAAEAAKAAAVAAAEAATQAAREDAAARTIQAAWRERVILRVVSDRLMQMYATAKETARLNEQYGAAVVTIQAQVRGYIVRELHPSAPAFAAIREQLR